MREIPVEVATLLKSRSMIGVNKPMADVTVDGLGGGFDWQTSYIAYNPHTSNADYHPSCVQLPDGKLLYMYSRGTEPGAIYQSYITDVDTIINQNNSVTNESVVLNNLYYPRATIFWGVDGNLYFAIAYTRTTTAQVAKVEIYKSTNKDGSDWALYSTIKSISWTGSSYNSSKLLPVSLPFFNGIKWIMAFPNFYNFYDFLASGVAIAESIDGITWVNKASYENGSAGTDTNFGSRNFGMINNELWWIWAGTYKSFFVKSIDGGQTWSQVFSTPLNDDFCKTIFSDNKKLFVAAVNSVLTSDLYSVSVSPTDWSNFADTNIDLPIGNSVYNDSSTLVVNVGNKLILMSGSRSSGLGVRVVGVDIEQIMIPVKSININRNKNMAGSLNLSVDNKNGEWSPDNTTHQNVLFPNKEITVKQGYGTNLIQTFVGLIDRIEMTTFPQELKLSIRDKLKLALDQTISGVGTHTLTYENQAVETIFTDLCSKAGLTTGTIETTGLSITKTFSWETYADCFSFLADLTGFEFGADETGLIYFRKDTTPLEPVIAYEFKEREDIISLGYTIDDNDIYSKVVVYGKDINDNVLFAQKEYVSKDYYKVLSQKFMKIDVSEASTVAQLQVIADRAEMLMRSRIREVSFASIAVPWLQVGDIIRVVESSTTISELYRVTDLSTNMDSNGYTMQITCYHHSA